MSHSTTETFKMKREILNYSGKISAPLRKPERKFFADMLYGILASGSCLLSEITQELHESAKKINVVDRLSRHLAKGTPQKAEIEYLRFIRRSVPAEPVVYIDDSDIVKPEGYHFEALGVVRDGSASSKDKTVYEKGYHVTEACVMTGNQQPISLYCSQIYFDSRLIQSGLPSSTGRATTNSRASLLSFVFSVSSTAFQSTARSCHSFGAQSGRKTCSQTSPCLRV